MDWKLFATVFATVFVAEVGDKTQLATLLYAADPARSKLTIALAASLALCVAAAIGVLAGAWLGKHVSPQALRWAAGGGFILIGVWTLLRA